MKRRNFIATSTLAAGTFLACKNHHSENSVEKVEDDTIKLNRVKTAMLAFQRYSWEQGVASLAMLDMGDEDTTICMAVGAVERQMQDGRLGRMNGTSVTDPMSNGEAVLFAWNKTGNVYFKNAFDKMLHYALQVAPKSEKGTIYHFQNSAVIWIDSMFMAPPFLAIAGEHNEAFKQIKGFREVLLDTETGLYKHQYNDKEKRFSRNVYWASGNGWAAAGIARTLLSIPSSEIEITNTLRLWLKELIDACWKYKTDDGYFMDIMNDTGSFKETTSGEMIAYAIYTAVRNKDLPESYLSKATELRNAAWRKIDEYGYVREAASMPDFVKPGISPEAQAFALMMESARLKIT